MKRVFAGLLMCSALGAWGQQLTAEQYDNLIAAIKDKSCKARPENARSEAQLINRFATPYDDAGVIEYLREQKYPNHTLFDLAVHYCIRLPKPLGRIDTWRYESCRTDAAKAPTERGVGVGINLCREKFGQ